MRALKIKLLLSHITQRNQKQLNCWIFKMIKKDKYINQGAVEHSDEFNEQASSEGWL